MLDLLNYLIQVNLLIIALCIGYKLLLKRLTFFRLNRLYFLLGGLYALVFPFLQLHSLPPTRNLLPHLELDSYSLQEYLYFREQSSTFTFANFLFYLVLLGAALIFIRWCMQLASLARIHRLSEPCFWQQFSYRNVLFPVAPFSFFNQIYLHKNQHHPQEMKHILAHEHIHIRQKHTFDILLYQGIVTLCWFNPAAWLLQGDVKQNLEFLTDQTLLRTGVNRKSYQMDLVRVNNQGLSLGATNQFNFHRLKQRILMMNKKRSSPLAASQYLILGVFILFIGLSVRISKAEDQIQELLSKADKIEMPGLKGTAGSQAGAAEYSMEREMKVQANPASTLLDRKELGLEKEKEKDGPENMDSSISLERNRDGKLNFQLYTTNRENHSLPEKDKMETLLVDPPLNTPKIEFIKVDNKELNRIQRDRDSLRRLYGDNSLPDVIVVGKARSQKFPPPTYLVPPKELPTVSFENPKTSLHSPGSNTLLADTFEEILFLLNDKQVDSKRIKSLNKENIESIEILKSSFIPEKYKENGKQAIIKIKTKGDKE